MAVVAPAPATPVAELLWVLVTLPLVGTDDVRELDEVAVAEDDEGGKMGVTKIDGWVGRGYVPADKDDEAVDADEDEDDDGKTTGVTMMDDECGA